MDINYALEPDEVEAGEGQGQDVVYQIVCITKDLGEQPHTQRAVWLGGHLKPSG